MDKPSPYIDLLKQGSWFGRLPAELQHLIVQRATVRTYRKGEFILREGEPTKGLFAVLEGRVRVLRMIADAKEVLLNIGEAGFWFGEYSIRAGTISIAGIAAGSAVRVLFLPVAEFERIVADEPRYYRWFADLVLDRYGLLMRYWAEGPNLSAEDWLRTRLRHLVGLRHGAKPSVDTAVITVSQSELATMVGVTRQTLGTLLARLQASGAIEVGFRSIRLLE